MAAVGGLIGAGFGYQAAAGAALGPGGTLVSVIVNSALWAGYAYGVTTAGLEWDVHKTSEALRADANAFGKSVEELGKKMQKQPAPR